MNSAVRLISFIEKLQEGKSYYSVCSSLFRVNDRYIQLQFYRYILNDIKRIEKLIKNQEGAEEKHYKPKISLLAHVASPNIEKHNYNHVESSIDYLKSIKPFMPLEKAPSIEFENLKISMKEFEKTDTVLDEIMGDIDDVCNYYGYFGDAIVEDKYNSVLGIVFEKSEKLVPLLKMYPKAATTLGLFLKFLKGTRAITEDANFFLNVITRMLEDKECSKEAIDIQVSEEE